MSTSAYHLYVISFTVCSEAGIAIVAAGDERSAVQILKRSGSRTGNYGGGYIIVQCRDLGITDCCSFGVLLESYVNAKEAYKAIVAATNALVGPKGDTGDVGPKGDKGDKGDKGNPFTYNDFTEEQLEALRGPQGEVGPEGQKGDTGARGPVGVETVSASASNTVGVPTVAVSLSDGHLSFFLSGFKGVPGEPGVSNSEQVVVTVLPTASDSTMGKIYLVKQGDTDVYNRYISEFDGEDYSWLQIGTTEISLDDYIRKDSIVYLTEEEWDALDVKDETKEYRIYEVE